MRITARLTASCDNSLRVWKWSKLVKVFPVVASRKRFLAHSINSMCTENVYRRFQGTDKTFRKINNCTKRGQFQFQTEYLPRTPEKKTSVNNSSCGTENVQQKTCEKRQTSILYGCFHSESVSPPSKAFAVGVCAALKVLLKMAAKSSTLRMAMWNVPNR